MKKLLILSALVIATFTARAQTTTNLAFRVTLETVTAGVTNANNLSWRYDYGTKKDALKVDGLNFAYASYTATFGTNTPTLTFQPWLKQNYNDFILSYAQQKQQVDNTALLAKITSLLTANSDLLSGSDLTSLNTIAAKAP